MSCKTRTPGCPGPFADASCAACIGGEDKCQGFSRKCTGVFGKPCGFCKSFVRQLGMVYPSLSPEKVKLAIAKSRSEHTKWFTGLRLGTLPNVKRLYQKTCRLSPAQIDQKLNSGKSITFCPWVQIGNLFTTVTTGNDQGWTELVTGLAKSGQKTFAIFTGRHGIEQGTIVTGGNGLLDDRMPDGKHLKEDLIKKVQVLKGFGLQTKPDIKLYNVGTTASTTMSKTQRLAVECLKQGDIVIFAWCFSLLSFYKVSVSEAATKISAPNLAYNKPIEDIVLDKYGWAQTACQTQASWVTVGHMRHVRVPKAPGDTLKAVQEWAEWRGKVRSHAHMV